MNDFTRRLTSRKLWATVGGLIVLGSNQQWMEFTILLASYLGVQGFSDVTEVKMNRY